MLFALYLVELVKVFFATGFYSGE